MSTKELEAEIKSLIDRCDESREQQAIKSVLLGVLAGILGDNTFGLMNHMAGFAEQEVKRLTAIRQRRAAEMN